jgi:acyl-CoA thioesterase
MGDFEIDTTVDGTDGRYRARLAGDWEIWGPNGGYVASVALRAAGRHTALGRPASFAGHFLGVADFDDVEIAVQSLRRTKRAESLRVTMTQRSRPVFEALVWAIGDVAGLEHEAASMPEVPEPTGLAPLEERVPPDAPPLFKFWDNLELRPTDWIEDWENRPPGQTRQTGWYRFRPRATFDDPFVDAARSLLVLDTSLWPAASRGHPGQQRFYAPSLDVVARFHAAEPGSEWLLVDAFSPTAADGLVGGVASVWSQSGRLLATGGQQMLCRPVELLDS